MPTGRLALSKNNAVLGGVCGGFAEFLGWDPTLVRIGFVLVSIFSAAFPGILVYLILWLIMPRS
jgi:phage shock protein C